MQYVFKYFPPEVLEYTIKLDFPKPALADHPIRNEK